MKTIIILLAALISLTALDGCGLSEEPQPKTELEKLPAATMEGKDTFGCLVNGKAWFTTSTTNATSDYQLGSLSIGGTIDGPFQSIGISLLEQSGNPLLTTGTYDLIPAATYQPWVSFFYSSSCYYGGVSTTRDDTISGTLTITKFDKSNYIISGLFQFTVAHTGCDTLRVTEGRFDIEYAP